MNAALLTSQHQKIAQLIDHIYDEYVWHSAINFQIEFQFDQFRCMIDV